MRITENRKLESSNSEKVIWTVEWDPQNENEDMIVAHLGVTIAVAKELFMLRKLADTPDKESFDAKTTKE